MKGYDMENTVQMKTVKLIGRFLRMWVDEGNISPAEYHAIHDHLKYLSEKGELKPVIMPKLITTEEAAEMLSIGVSNFKKIEGNGGFSFKRKMIGTAVRYRNTDIIKYLTEG